MPKKPKITLDQWKVVAEGLARHRSMATIRKRTKLSDSSINRMKAECRAVLESPTKTKQDGRIQRRLHYFGWKPNALILESDLQKLEALACANPKAAELLDWINERNEQMRNGTHRNYSIAQNRAKSVDPKVRAAIIEGFANGLLSPQQIRAAIAESGSEIPSHRKRVKPR